MGTGVVIGMHFLGHCWSKLGITLHLKYNLTHVLSSLIVTPSKQEASACIALQQRSEMTNWLLTYLSMFSKNPFHASSFDVEIANADDKKSHLVSLNV
jgi:hypothetical protein